MGPENDDQPDQRHHEDLGADECWRLLGAAKVGRIAFLEGQRIQVFPVNHVVLEHAIYFRTSPYGPAGLHLRDASASFQVDEYDVAAQTGWSVLATGTAAPVEDPSLLATLWGSTGPEPWAAGLRSLFISLDVGHLSGRRVHP